jgi:hypothetical protein
LAAAALASAGATAVLFWASARRERGSARMDGCQGVFNLFVWCLCMSGFVS